MINQDLFMIFSIFVKNPNNHEYFRKSWFGASKKRLCKGQRVWSMPDYSYEQRDTENTWINIFWRGFDLLFASKRNDKNFRWKAVCLVWSSEQAFNNNWSGLADPAFVPLLDSDAEGPGKICGHREVKKNHPGRTRLVMNIRIIHDLVSREKSRLYEWLRISAEPIQ